MHDVDGAVRKLGRDISHRGIFAGGEHAHAGDENDCRIAVAHLR